MSRIRPLGTAGHESLLNIKKRALLVAVRRRYFLLTAFGHMTRQRHYTAAGLRSDGDAHFTFECEKRVVVWVTRQK